MRLELLVLLTALALPAGADSSLPGFSLTHLANPAGASATCSLPDGDFVTFNGVSVDRWNADGSLELHLWSAPGAVFASFVEATPDGSAVIVGDSGNGAGVAGDLHQVALDGSGAQWLASVPFNYDGSFAPNGDLVVSAATAGFGNGNDLVRLRWSPLSVTSIGHVDGPSGPLAFSRNGDLYYATQPSGFPPPLGASDIVRWSASQLASNTWLDDTNATTVADHFQSVSSLAFDPSKGRLYAADNDFMSNVYRVLRVKTSVANSVVVANSDTWIVALRFQDLGSGASFDAYQPGDGVSLVFETTDFVALDDLVTVAPARPTLQASGPGVTGVGAVDLHIGGGVPNGAALFTYCPQTNIMAGEVGYPLPNFLHFSPFMLSATVRFNFLVPLDSNGAGSLALWNPGGLNGLYGWQVLVGKANGTLVGSTNAVQF